jgi:uncharacterized protein
MKNKGYPKGKDHRKKKRNLLLLIVLALFICGLVAVIYTNRNFSSFTNISNSEVTPKLEVINNKTGGNVANNTELMHYIPKTQLNDEVIATARKGTPMVTFGDGSQPRVMLVVGVHGNELPSQAAVMRLINDLQGKKINGTVYIVPFVAPGATSINSKYLDGVNPSAVANVPGSPTNVVFNFAKNHKVSSVAEFHATRPGSKNPGKTCVIYYPSSSSEKMAGYISDHANSPLMDLKSYSGYLIKIFNTNGTTSVICEVASPNGKVAPGSVDVSYKQMIAFLKYNKIL